MAKWLISAVGDARVHRPDPGIPFPGPVTIAISEPVRSPLVGAGADPLRSLKVNQRSGEHLHRLPKEVTVLVHAGLAQPLQKRESVVKWKIAPEPAIVERFEGRWQF